MTSGPRRLPDVQAAILGLVQVFERRIAPLEARLNQNSSNSSKPPSTEPLHLKRQPHRPTSKKPRGGQAGHKRHTRELVPADQLTGSLEIKPHSPGRSSAVEKHLWRFADVAGVAPDNNAAERALRHGVIWRKLSVGKASEAGSRFVERLLWVVETCRQRGRSVAALLTACFKAKRNGQSIPSPLT